MSINFRSWKAAGAVAAATLGLSMTLVAPAQAATGGGEVRDGISALACVNVGGGTHCRGTSRDGLRKKCYSNYVHNENYHSSTAVLADLTSKRFGDAGYWSNANVTSGWAYTCYAYWNNEA